GGSNNTVLVADNGSWINKATLYVGGVANGSSNVLLIAGGSVFASNVIIGYFDPTYIVGQSNNVVKVDSGSLLVTNPLGTGTLIVSRAGGKGSLIVNGGSVTVDSLIATNSANSVVQFNGGLLNSEGTAVTNTQQFVVGDGTNSAAFHLSGGVHSFNN